MGHVPYATVYATRKATEKHINAIHAEINALLKVPSDIVDTETMADVINHLRKLEWVIADDLQYFDDVDAALEDVVRVRDDYMSVTQAADYLGITRTRVQQLIDGGKLEAQMIGNTWAIDGASVRKRADDMRELAD